MGKAHKSSFANQSVCFFIASEFSLPLSHSSLAARRPAYCSRLFEHQHHQILMRFRREMFQCPFFNRR
ncbi:hypothetical protein TNIN_122691 [Trichonephila inaurata madagascariensis]|uniref:Uncharacterized protein n=1 Tax=Trichonephila inaurata madagascariensis TaxID=2747483 RepID=A0A8X6YEI8_9ARAC|nr:hypothetical protein TNIN_122691 [Trichonephila inaurata madagascariensis]